MLKLRTKVFKMIEKIQKNKFSVLLLLALFLILVYCHLNTMILNDDLPYSLYFRTSNRVTSIIGVIKNQIFDYSKINARVFLHCIVQFLLIYDKNLWSIINPIVIILNIIFIAYFIKQITKVKTNNINLLVLAIISFLLLYNYKYLIYWVAGSVNYVWIFLVLILISIYYYKFGLTRYKKITSLICLFVSMLCEVSAIFVISLLITDLLIKLFIEKKSPQLIKIYLVFLIFSLIGFAFILLAPSTLNRLDGDVSWQKLSLIEKLSITIPTISANLFKIDIYNLYPLLSILSISLYFCKKNGKKGICLSLAVILLYTIIYFIGDFSWFIMTILLFLLQTLIFWKEKNYKLISILVAINLISYSLAITNEYSAGRVNMHFDLFSFIFSAYNFLQVGKLNKPLRICAFILMLILIVLELIIYNYIGEVKRERLNSIKSVQQGKSKILETKLIKSPFDKFHIDANNPLDKNYWAYKAFEDYYQLPSDIEIVSKK